MAEIKCLRKSIHSKLIFLHDNVVQAHADSDIPGILESLEVLMACVILLDSFDSVPEQVFNFLMQAHGVLSIRPMYINIHGYPYWILLPPQVDLHLIFPKTKLNI